MKKSMIAFLVITMCYAALFFCGCSEGSTADAPDEQFDTFDTVETEAEDSDFGGGVTLEEAKMLSEQDGTSVFVKNGDEFFPAAGKMLADLHVVFANDAEVELPAGSELALVDYPETEYHAERISGSGETFPFYIESQLADTFDEDSAELFLNRITTGEDGTLYDETLSQEIEVNGTEVTKGDELSKDDFVVIGDGEDYLDRKLYLVKNTDTGIIFGYYSGVDYVEAAPVDTISYYVRSGDIVTLEHEKTKNGYERLSTEGLESGTYLLSHTVLTEEYPDCILVVE